VIEEAIREVEAGRDLSMDAMTQVMGAVMEGKCSEDALAHFLLALRAKGESVTEVAGAAAAMRRHVTPVRTRRCGVLDTCGTGGDGSRTFNISTAAAIVTAAAGVPVAKHGNRSITSRSGSADVLAALGVHIDADVARVEACLEQLGLCFCFAPLLHTAMKHVGPVRKRLGVPTIFNILGPLANPAAAPLQLIGVGRKELQTLLAEALGLLGTERAVVVHGDDGLDEVSLATATQVTLVERGTLRRWSWRPEQFGLTAAGLESLRIDGPEQSAAIIRNVLDGGKGPARDIVVLNAAAALWTARASDAPQACAQKAAEAIDNGAAADLLGRLARLSAGE
jgi:anthranilate phosphoribosyltransferase